MNTLTAKLDSKTAKTKYLIVIALSALLIVYHITKLITLYITDLDMVYNGLIHFQSVIRIGIVGHLILLVMGKQKALYGMWVSIVALIITQYVDYFMNDGASIAIYSYLKGLIIPIIITLVYPIKK